MKKIYCLLCLLPFISCSRDKDKTESPAPFVEPVIIKVNNSFVQGGDTLTVYGNHLLQAGAQTELAVSGRAAKLVTVTNDSLRAIVPMNTYSGNLMVTISRGNRYISVYGPGISVAASPEVLRVAPWTGYEGDTVSFIVKNFADNLQDNFIWMDGKSAKVVAYNGKDTIKAIIPEGANTNTFAWRTFNGPQYQSEKEFPVRKLQYNATNVIDWLGQDPAYSYLYAILASDAVKGYWRSYDTLMHFFNTDKEMAYFLPTNDGWMAEGFSSATQLINTLVNPTPYVYVNASLASMVPGDHPPSTLTPGTYETVLTENIVYPGDSWRTHRKNPVQIEQAGNEWSIQAYTIWNTGIGTPLKIERVHKIGNKYLYEVKKMLPYDSDY
jgi:hypothetical protein